MGFIHNTDRHQEHATFCLQIIEDVVFNVGLLKFDFAIFSIT